MTGDFSELFQMFLHVSVFLVLRFFCILERVFQTFLGFSKVVQMFLRFCCRVLRFLLGFSRCFYMHSSFFLLLRFFVF